MTTSALSPSLPFLSVPPPASKKNPGALQRRPLSSCRRPPPPRGALRRGNAPPLRFSRSSDDDRSGSLSRQVSLRRPPCLLPLFFGMRRGLSLFLCLHVYLKCMRIDVYASRTTRRFRFLIFRDCTYGISAKAVGPH
jgi:hypothetical protein